MTPKGKKIFNKERKFRLRRAKREAKASARKKGIDVLAPVLVLGAQGGAIQARVLAVVDTGAQLSVVSAKLVEKLGLQEKIEPCDTATFRAWGKECKRTGKLQLRILCGDQSHVMWFDVQEEADDELLLGTDILPTLGLAVINIPAQFPDEYTSREAREEADSEEEPLRVRPKPWQLRDQIPKAEHAQLLAALKDLLQENADITMKEPACPTLEEAIMRLPTEAEHCFKRQYPIPFAAMLAVREQLLKWEEMGHIGDAPAGSVWNTPLLVVAKKDPNGLKTLYRICMDFRALNALLDEKDSVNVLPTAEDIFRQMSGFKYASVLELPTTSHSQRR
jgi:hypothetical protein